MQMGNPCVSTPKMKEETKAMLAEAFKVSVRKYVAAGAHTKWGEAESCGVICDLIETMASDPDATAEGVDCIRGNIRKLVNPSSFVQTYLEPLPESHPSHVRRAKRAAKEKGIEV